MSNVAYLLVQPQQQAKTIMFCKINVMPKLFFGLTKDG